jgi:hypothetical protein
MKKTAMTLLTLAALVGAAQAMPKDRNLQPMDGVPLDNRAMAAAPSTPEPNPPPEGQHALMGEVVQIRSQRLVLRTEEGALVPIDATNLKLTKRIHEGDEVRATFNVERKTENVATALDRVKEDPAADCLATATPPCP